MGHIWRASPANRARVSHSACQHCGRSTNLEEIKEYLRLRYGIDRNWLQSNYIESADSLDDLWRKTGVGHGVIRRALKAHGITKSRLDVQAVRTSKREATNSVKYGHPNPNGLWLLQTKSKPEVEIAELLESAGYDFVWSETQFIAPKELDFYLPGLNLAIEFNGDYWHDRELWEADLLKGTCQSREMVKTKLCEAFGIQLLHIWESEWTEAESKAGHLQSVLAEALSLGSVDC